MNIGYTAVEFIGGVNRERKRERMGKLGRKEGTERGKRSATD